MSEVDIQELTELISDRVGDETALIAVLQEIQRKLKYLPVEAMKFVAEKLNVPLSRVYHVATFYKAFKLNPPGQHQVRICVGTACHVRGASRLVDAIEREYGMMPGETSADGKLEHECVNCLGACALAPVVVIDDKTLPKQTPDKLTKNIEKILKS
ncbi:MAG: NAD(P)H-dependent oxidoreductase subunit E [Planctomycetes bacterium]|nr:NAD(P)H-dependent oxidoreductase subunit E [Planctomycetota bacterium]